MLLSIKHPVPPPELALEMLPSCLTVPGTAVKPQRPSSSGAATFKVVYVVYTAIPSGVVPTLKRL